MNVLDLNPENLKGDTSSFYNMLQNNINDQQAMVEREFEDSDLNILKGNNVFKKEELKKREKDQISDAFLPKEWIGFFYFFYRFSIIKLKTDEKNSKMNNEASYAAKHIAKLNYLDHKVVRQKRSSFGRINEIDHDDSEEEFRDLKPHKIISVEHANSQLELEINQLKMNIKQKFKGSNNDENLNYMNESAKKIQRAYRNYQKYICFVFHKNLF